MREFFRRIGSAFVRVSAFLTKDISTALSYPGLIGVLVLGPFLILLVFGVSYRDVYRTLRAMIVVPPNSELQDTVRAFAESPEFVIDVVEITPNETRWWTSS
jgi:ABC-2 type transport system permease protein